MFLWLHSNSQVDLAIIVLTIIMHKVSIYTQVGASTLDLNVKWAVLDLAMKR